MWSPLIAGADADRCEAVVIDVLADLATRGAPTNDWGDTLLNGYYGVARCSSPHRERSLDGLSRAADCLSTTYLKPGLFGGVAGVGWLIAHVSRLLDVSADLSFDELDAAIVGYAHHPLAHGYDLIAGACGLGIYFLERLPNIDASSGLELLGDALIRCAEVDRHAVTWSTPPELLPPWQRSFAPGGYYNLGVAHGIPGILGLFGSVRRTGRWTSHEPIFRRGMCWLMDQRTPDGLYPSWLVHGQSASSAKSNWCYGALGVSVALLMASCAMDDAAAACFWIDVAKAAARRPEIDVTYDAGLCHGACGNAHLFNRLYQATGEEAFRAAALLWFERAIDMRRPGVGVAGYRSWKPLDVNGNANPSTWNDDVSFLTGAAGVALALLAAISPVEPLWDRVLLTDISPRSTGALGTAS